MTDARQTKVHGASDATQNGQWFPLRCRHALIAFTDGRTRNHHAIELMSPTASFL